MPLLLEHSMFLTPLAVSLELELLLSIPKSLSWWPHWPPNSPGINPADFYSWDYIKDLGYNEKSTDLISLKSFITDSFSTIEKETLDFVTDKFVIELRYCITSEVKTLKSHLKTLFIKFLFHLLFNKKLYVVLPATTQNLF